MPRWTSGLRTWLVLRLAGAMVRFLGPAGIDSMTRIFGFLLVCIGMQFLLTGIADFYGLRLGAARAQRGLGACAGRVTPDPSERRLPLVLAR
jgi:hypothetical protein